MLWLYEAFGQFEKTGNARILKDINEKVFIFVTILFRINIKL